MSSRKYIFLYNIKNYFIGLNHYPAVPAGGKLTNSYCVKLRKVTGVKEITNRLADTTDSAGITISGFIWTSGLHMWFI